MSIENVVRSRFVELGADLVGFAHPTLPRSYHDKFRRWIDHDMHGGMEYLAKRPRMGCDCKDLLPNVASVVVLAFNYHFDVVTENESPSGTIGKYASFRDYHKSVGAVLKNCAKFLKSKYAADCRTFVDASPLMERAYAECAGLGFIGKSGMLITRQFGTYVFLATILTSIELKTDLAIVERACGGCKACQSACPTSAINGDGTVDARKCISYLTIENGYGIPIPLRPLLSDAVFGCDKCQQICPFNTKPTNAESTEFIPRIPSCRLPLTKLLSIDSHESFVELFAGLPIMRAKWRGIVRNACVAAGNSGNRALIPILTKLIDTTDDDTIREHAEWAAVKIELSTKLDSQKSK